MWDEARGEGRTGRLGFVTESKEWINETVSDKGVTLVDPPLGLLWRRMIEKGWTAALVFRGKVRRVLALLGWAPPRQAAYSSQVEVDVVMTSTKAQPSNCQKRSISSWYVGG